MTVEGRVMAGLGEREFRLKDWLVSPKLNSISNNGKTVRLEPKVMQVLVCLAETGDVVSKEKLMGRVWTGTFVTDDVLTRSISELRKIFDDDPKKPQFIQTISKGGYRLLVHVEELPASGNGAREIAPREKSQVSESNDKDWAPGVASETSGSTRFRLWSAASAAAIVAAVLLAVAALFSVSKRPAPRPVPATGRAMLAILPFQNLNNDPAQDYFADGLTAEMISQFGRLPADRLGVIAWSSMMRYKGSRKSEQEVGSELGANYVLEGTVRRAGDRVRITAELVRVGERSHIWANSYDGDLKDVLALQSRVAQEIASEIQARMAPAATDGALSVNDSLQPASPAKSTTRGPVNAEGYDAYLRGKAMTDGGQMLDAAEEHLKKAIELNPRYAAPYITLAMYYQTQASWEFAPSKSTYAKAKNAALKAIELEPDSGAAHRELGWVYWRGDWNFAAADKEYQTALKLDSGSAATHEQYALFLKSTGRYDDALREINRCLELSPMQSISHANAGTILGLTHQYDSAQGQFSRALELDPRAEYVYRRMGAVLLWQSKNDQALKVFQKAVDTSGGRPEDLAWLAYGYAVSGMRDASSDVLNQILRQSETQHVSPFYVAMVYAGLGDKDQAFTWLENAFNSHDEWMVYLKIYPEFASLSNDPRFADLARRVGLH